MYNVARETALRRARHVLHSQDELALRWRPCAGPLVVLWRPVAAGAIRCCSSETSEYRQQVTGQPLQWGQGRRK